jgi:hypothetical protein
MRASLLAIAAIFATHAAAQKWEKEPSAVAGVPLGGEVASVATCPEGSYTSRDLCLSAPLKLMPDLFRQIRGMPDLGFYYSATAAVLQGRIESIQFDLDQRDWPKLRAALIERYGAPTSSRMTRVQTIGGAQLTSEDLLWQGTSVTIRAFERTRRIDKAAAVFEDNLLADVKRQQLNQRTSEGAKKL